jgi:hypothetical protein
VDWIIVSAADLSISFSNVVICSTCPRFDRRKPTATCLVLQCPADTLDGPRLPRFCGLLGARIRLYYVLINKMRVNVSFGAAMRFCGAMVELGKNPFRIGGLAILDRSYLAPHSTFRRRPADIRTDQSSSCLGSRQALINPRSKCRTNTGRVAWYGTWTVNRGGANNLACPNTNTAKSTSRPRP